jgi:quercetin dioxygenase-like cupin family protein
MKVVRIRPEGRRPADGAMFRGAVRIQEALGAADTSEHRVSEVTFTDGARTKLHTHTTDQLLVITAGLGVVGTRDERHEVTAGDVVLIPKREPHFHGAREGADMTHLSVLGDSENRILE